MKENPLKDRVDLSIQLSWPTLSWSSMSSFGYDPESWYEQYYKGIRQAPNAVMRGGIDVGERITQDETFLPELPRPEIYEQNFSAMFNGITLTGHLDGWSPSVPGIDEYKTSSNPNRWTQKAVDEWGQISFYCFLVWLNLKIKPESLRLRLMSIPMVEDGNFNVQQKGPVKIFHTKRTMADILKFGVLIKSTYAEMEKFIHNHD